MLHVVLLPGMDGTGELFAPFVAALGPAARVHIVRYPPDRVLGYDALERIARDALPSDADFVLLGESFSGPIAVSIAASAPARLKGLVLCASFVKNPRSALAGIRPFLGVIPVKHVPVGILSIFLMGRFATRAAETALASAMRQVSAGAMRARARAVLEIDATAAMSRVTVPVLYLQGRKDRVVPRSAWQEIARLRPTTRIVKIDAPHFVLQVAPVPAAEAFWSFVAGLRDADA